MEEEQGSKKVRSLGIRDNTCCIHTESSGENTDLKYTRKDNVWSWDCRP